MNEQEYKKLIAKNLKRIFLEAGKTQADVSKDLKINKATLSCWMNGTHIPRMGKIDQLCHYFNCTRADIMEEHADAGWVYVLQSMTQNDKETQQLLFDITRLDKDNRETINNTVKKLLAYQNAVKKSPC